MFKRTISVDDNYLFTVRQEVQNNSSEPVVLYPYARVQRQEIPEIEGFIILHEGLVGVLNEELQELDYDDVKETPGRHDHLVEGRLARHHRQILGRCGDPAAGSGSPARFSYTPVPGATCSSPTTH